MEQNQNKIDFSFAEDLIYFDEDKFYKDFKKLTKYFKGQITANNLGFDEELYISEYQKLLDEEYNKALNSIKYYKLQCPYCGRFLRSIDNRHLKQHNLTVEEFTKEWIGSTPTEIIATKLIDLYNPYYFKWGEQQDDGSYIVLTYNRDDVEKVSYTCNITTIKQHLNHNKTVGVFPIESKNKKNVYFAKFIDFDVDTSNKDHVIKLIRVLRHYVKLKNIHISISGSKGYHITIFFKEFLTVKQIQALGQKIKQLAKLDIKQIEIFPKNKKCIKLPLGIHRVTNNLCLFLDKQFRFIENQFKYVLNIDGVDGQEIINKVLNTAEINFKDKNTQEAEAEHKQVENKPAHKSVDLSIKQDHKSMDTYCKKIFEQGLKELGTRHKNNFYLSLWMKDILKWDKEKASIELEEWIHRNFENGLVHSLQDALKNNKAILRSVYDKNKYHITYKEYNITISEYEFKDVMRLKNKYERYIYLAFIIYGKIFNSDSFYLSQKELSNFISVSNRTINKYLNLLLKKKKCRIELLSKGKWYGNDSYASEYRIPILSEDYESSNGIDINIKGYNCLEVYKELNKYFN